MPLEAWLYEVDSLSPDMTCSGLSLVHHEGHLAWAKKRRMVGVMVFEPTG